MTDEALVQLSTASDQSVYVHDPKLQCSPLSFQKPLWAPKAVPGVRRCTCKSSRCLKKYCVCYAAGVACGPHCFCTDCHNTEPRTISEQEKEKPLACTCRKSRCLKMYCVCYAKGMPCGDSCCCTGCENGARDKPCAETPVRTQQQRRKRKRVAPVSLDSFLDSLLDEGSGCGYLNEMTQL